MLRFVEAFDCGRETILVLEYLEGGELFERIVDEENELLESDCCFYLRQICGVKVKSSAVCVNFVFSMRLTKSTQSNLVEFLTPEHCLQASFQNLIFLSHRPFPCLLE